VTVAEIFLVDFSDRFGDWYDTTVCAERVGPVELGGGVTLSATADYETAMLADLVVVPGWSLETPPHATLVSAVRRASDAGARIMSICTGAFVLGHAGLLDGRRATTHWAEASELARRFPLATIEPRALFIDAGPVLTSAGMSAGIDLALHVVRGDYGVAAANALASRLVLPAYRSGGQAQFVDFPLTPAADDPVPDLLEWLRTHLDQPHHLADLAARVHVSPRTLTRRFQSVTGTTPQQWLTRERVVAAQRLLEDSDRSVEQIARRIGFSSAAHLRQLFRRHVGSSPREYRAAFQARRAATLH
jgi:AraC family transcriptional activator FtrA